MRLRRGSPWLRHADGDSNRSGEFHRGDLVGHDERFPLRGQPAASSTDSLDARINSTAGDLDTGFPSTSHNTNITRCTSVIGNDSATRAYSERQFDLAERFLGSEQQRSRTASHTRQAINRDTGRRWFHLRGSRLRGVLRCARWCERGGRDTAFSLVLSGFSGRLELQSASSPGFPLLVHGGRIVEPSSDLRG